MKPKFNESRSCPLCGKPLDPHYEEKGVIRYFCDCAGFSRPVIEILQEGVKEDDSAD